MVQWRGLLGEGPSGCSVSIQDSRFRMEAQQPPPQTYTQFRLLGAPPTSLWAWRVCITLSTKGVPYNVHHASSLEDGGQIEVLSKKLLTNTPIQQRTPALEFVDGGNDVFRIPGSNTIFNFLESEFPDRGGPLLPPDPVAQARAIELSRRSTLLFGMAAQRG